MGNDPLERELDEAIALGQKLRELHEKHQCAPFEVGTAIFHFDQFRARVMRRRALAADEEGGA